LIAATIAVGNAAEPLPYGHKDFVPSPEQPIYFRAGNGYYPGATPPLSWWEGTPTKRKVTYQKEGKDREAMIDDFADTKSSNILWKVPVPGWTLSHPIVVKDRVFAVGEPDFVTCWDLNTGKVLWQRRIMPLLCDGLPEEKAAAGQKVLDLARAFFYIGSSWSRAGMQKENLFRGGFSKKRLPDLGLTPEEMFTHKQAVAAKYLAGLEPHRADVVAFGDEALVKALDADLEEIRKFTAVKTYDELKALVESQPKETVMNLVKGCADQLAVDVGGHWWGYVGSADSTLVSDGQRIYGVFDQGQVFCLDLDGKTVWLQREKGCFDSRATFHRAPTLCGDLLIVRDRKSGDGYVGTLRAMDTKSGNTRWSTPWRLSYTVQRVMPLNDPSGKAVDILIGDLESDKGGQVVLRVSDGKILGYLPPPPGGLGRGARMMIWGDLMTYGCFSDSGKYSNCVFRLAFTGPETVSGTILHGFPKGTVTGGHFLTGLPGMFLGNSEYEATLFSLADGKPVGIIPGKFNHDLGTVVAGKYLILANGSDRLGADKKRMVCYTVVDIGDPAKPKIVSENNLLGYDDPTADIILRTYFKELDPFQFMGCYLGVAGYVHEMGGPVPHGNKMLIQTSAYMYCIGEK
jgi:outer membrane protein assembly factor BamB